MGDGGQNSPPARQRACGGAEPIKAGSAGPPCRPPGPGGPQLALMRATTTPCADHADGGHSEGPPAADLGDTPLAVRWRVLASMRWQVRARASCPRHPACSCEAPVGHPSSAAPRARLTERRRTFRRAAGAHRGCLGRGWPTRIQTSRRIRTASAERARTSKPNWSKTRAGGGVSRTPDRAPVDLFFSPQSVPFGTSGGPRPDSKKKVPLRWLMPAHSRRSPMLWRQQSAGAGRQRPPTRGTERSVGGGAGGPQDTNAVRASFHPPPPALSCGGTGVPLLRRRPRPAFPTDLSGIRWQAVLCVPRGRPPPPPSSPPHRLQLELPPLWPAPVLLPPSNGTPAAAAPSTRAVSAAYAAALSVAPLRRQSRSTLVSMRAWVGG